MKYTSYTKSCCVLIFLFSFTLISVGQSFAGWKFWEKEDKIPRVAIISFADQLSAATKAQELYSLPPSMADRISEVLLQSKRFQIVDRDLMQRTMNEKLLAKESSSSFFNDMVSNLIDKEVPDSSKIGDRVFYNAQGGQAALIQQLQNVGLNVKADYLLFGTLEKIKSQNTVMKTSSMPVSIGKSINEMRVRLRIIDVETSNLIGIINEKSVVENWGIGNVQPDKHDLLDIFCKDIGRRVVDVIYPAKLAGSGPFVITRGSNDGVKEGDLFAIARPGEEVKEEGVGVIGRINKKIGVMRVVDVQERLSTVEPVSGSGFVADDMAYRKSSGEKKVQRGDQGASSAATGNYNGLQLNKKKKANTRSSIAIRSIKIYGASKKKAASLRRRINGDLTSKLIASNRFDVAEKAELSAIIDEALFEEALQGGGIQARLQQLQGVDYILATELRSLKAKITVEKVPYIDETEVSGTMHSEGYIRVINTHTGRVEVAKKIFISEPLAENMAVGRFIDSFCTQAVRSILDGLYPMKIIHTSGDICFVNRGKDGGMVVGEKYDVFRVGEEMLDSDTGASYGAFEERIGCIQCERTEEKRSMCRVIDGMDFTAGDVVRQAKVRKQEVESVKTAAQPQW